MASKKHYVGYTVRVPPELKAQIDARSEVNGRSLSEESRILMERGIDASVNRDRKISSEAASGQKSS